MADPDLLIGGGEGVGCRPNPEVRGGGGGLLSWIRHCLPANTVISSLSSPQGTRNVSRGGERGGTALLAGSKDLGAYCLGNDLSVIFGMISFTP